MSDPLPVDVVTRLQSDPTAALAAALILAGSFPDLVSWAVRVFSGGRSNGAANDLPTANGSAASQHVGSLMAGREKRKATKLDVAAYQARRIAQRDADDERLIEAMRQAPDDSIKDWSASLGKCRTAIVHGLHRLRAAGLVENDGKWVLTEASTNAQSQPATSSPRWIEPLSANHVAKHAAGMRVRGELATSPSA